jgi:mono/diheme cytochrome c family protein
LASRSKSVGAWVAALAASAALAHDAETNYVLHCQGCHTADGSGLEGKVPDLRPTLVPFASTAEGRKYLVQVPGVAQSPLDDAETAAVLNWMLRNLAAEKRITGVQAFTSSEVAGYRATRLIEVRAKRERLLAQLAGDKPREVP